VSGGFGTVAVDYFGAHAIDPELATACGVREVEGELVFPYRTPNGAGFTRLRSLNGGSAKVKQPPERSLALWWPLRRPRGAEAVLVCEGESDALAALEPLSESRFASLELVALPGTGFPAKRLAEQLVAVGTRDAFLALDADEAGRRYAEKAASALREAGIRPIVVEFEDAPRSFPRSCWSYISSAVRASAASRQSSRGGWWPRP